MKPANNYFAQKKRKLVKKGQELAPRRLSALKE